MEKTTFCIITLLIGSGVFWIIRHMVKRYGIKKEDSESSNLMKTHKAGLLKHMYWLLNIIYIVLFESMILIISLEQFPIPTVQSFQQYKEHLIIDEVKETGYSTIMLLNKLVDYSGKTSYKYAVCMERNQCYTDDDIYTFYSDHILNSEDTEYEMETRNVIVKFPYRISYSMIDIEKRSEKKLLYEWKIPGLDTGNSLSQKEKEKQSKELLTANYTFYQEAVEESRRTEKFKIAFSMVLLTGIFLIVIQN